MHSERGRFVIYERQTKRFATNIGKINKAVKRRNSLHDRYRNKKKKKIIFLPISFILFFDKI